MCLIRKFDEVFYVNLFLILFVFLDLLDFFEFLDIVLDLVNKYGI